MDFDKLMNYQNMVQKRLRQEQQRDRKIDLLSIINQLTAGPKNIVQKEQLIIEAQNRGFSEKEIDDLLEQLKEDNIVTEPSPGFIKKK